MQRSGIPALAVLCEYDTVIVVDDSASMMWENRWQEVGFFSISGSAVLGGYLTVGFLSQTKIALGTLAEIVSQLDTDGITICFLNSDVIKNNVTVCIQLL